MQTRDLECCKQRMMGGSGRSSENQTADRKVDSKDCAHAVSGENKDSTGILVTLLVTGTRYPTPAS